MADPDAGDPGSTDSGSTDTGSTPIGTPPRFVTMDGILEGRIGDGAAIARAVQELSRLGICAFELDRDGGKFTVMPENRQVRGDRFDLDKQNELLQHLCTIAKAARGPVESTLRCTMVFDTECAETLFRAAVPTPEGQSLEPLTRMRPRRADDVPPDLPPPPPWQQLLKRREVLIALPLLLIAFTLLAWQSGLVDRLLSANATGLEVQNGAFGGLLHAEVENNWGDYRVVLKRGPEHPADAAAWDAYAAAAKDEAARLHGVVVREGQDIYLQLRDESDHVLAETKASLRPLVTSAEGKVTVDLPGRMTATRLVLSVTKYEKQ